MAIKNIVFLASLFSIISIVTSASLPVAAQTVEGIEASFPTVAPTPVTSTGAAMPVLPAMPASLGSPAGSATTSNPYNHLGTTIINFGYVSPQLLRGSQPSRDGLIALQKAGVKTVVNLRHTKDDISEEREIVESLGMKFVSIPLTLFKGVRKDQVDKFLSAVTTDKTQPTFVHCRQGQDRCGTMVAMYRLHEQGWSAERAYKEMIAFGFHPMFIALRTSVYDTSSELGRPCEPPPSGEIVTDLKARFKRKFGDIDL